TEISGRQPSRRDRVAAACSPEPRFPISAVITNRSCQNKVQPQLLKSVTRAVLAALKRAEFVAHQKIILHVDNLIAISGFTADAERYVIVCARSVWIPHSYWTDLFLFIPECPCVFKTQIRAQRKDWRPHGAGCLLWCEDTGPHIAQTCPFDYFDCGAMSTVAGSPSAHTYFCLSLWRAVRTNWLSMVCGALQESLPAEQDTLQRVLPPELLSLHSWRVLKKDHTKKNSLPNLLMHLQKRQRSQWNIEG
ncbi:Proteasome subunit alpha type-1, partial [Galemys pyrenaicus]